MRINEVTKLLSEQELLAHEARELIVELLVEVDTAITKITPFDRRELPVVDSLIEFLEGVIKRSIQEFSADNSPDAEFIRNDGVQLLQHIKSRRKSL
jgi:hypothetical protein